MSPSLLHAGTSFPNVVKRRGLWWVTTPRVPRPPDGIEDLFTEDLFTAALFFPLWGHSETVQVETSNFWFSRKHYELLWQHSNCPNVDSKCIWKFNVQITIYIEHCSLKCSTHRWVLFAFVNIYREEHSLLSSHHMTYNTQWHIFYAGTNHPMTSDTCYFLSFTLCTFKVFNCVRISSMCKYFASVSSFGGLILFVTVLSLRVISSPPLNSLGCFSRVPPDTAVWTPQGQLALLRPLDFGFTSPPVLITFCFFAALDSLLVNFLFWFSIFEKCPRLSWTPGEKVVTELHALPSGQEPNNAWADFASHEV
jgi:hypothetical protein